MVEPTSEPKLKSDVQIPEHQKPEPHPEAAKLAELEDRLLRLHAEFENYKKRALKENEAIRENSVADAMLKLLPIVDDFEMALLHCNSHPHAHPHSHGGVSELVHGMELIYVKLRDLLKKEGVEEMKSLHENFDPYKHDAIRQGEGPEGKVVEVIQKGYTFKGKVLRHAKVVVGAGTGN